MPWTIIQLSPKPQMSESRSSIICGVVVERPGLITIVVMTFVWTGLDVIGFWRYSVYTVMNKIDLHARITTCIFWVCLEVDVVHFYESIFWLSFHYSRLSLTVLLHSVQLSLTSQLACWLTSRIRTVENSSITNYFVKEKTVDNARSVFLLSFPNFAFPFPTNFLSFYSSLLHSFSVKSIVVCCLRATRSLSERVAAATVAMVTANLRSS